MAPTRSNRRRDREEDAADGVIRRREFSATLERIDEKLEDLASMAKEAKEERADLLTRVDAAKSLVVKIAAGSASAGVAVGAILQYLITK